MATEVIRSTVKQALLTALDPLRLGEPARKIHRQQPLTVHQTMASDIQVALVTYHYYYKLPIGTRVCALTLPEPEPQYINNNPLYVLNNNFITIGGPS